MNLDFLEGGWMKTATAAITLVVTAGGAGYGVFKWHDTTYERRDNVQLIEMRLEQKILNDRAAAIRNRMWTIEQRCGDDLEKCNETVKEEYQRLEVELGDILEEIQQIRAQQRSQNAPSRYYDRDMRSVR